MSLFELQRIWDAWLNIHNAQVLRALFRQVSTHPTSGNICRVFVIPGHLFVATSHTNIHHTEGLYSVQLYAFSRVPVKHDSDVTNCQLPLTEGCSRIVNILDSFGENLQQIWVIHDSGELSVFDLDTDHYCWKLRECIKLSSNQSIHSCVVYSNYVVYCEKVAMGARGSCYQVSCRNYQNVPDGSLTLSAPTVLLTDSPPMELQLFEDGVCLLPSSGPTPRGLILMWRRGDKRMEPYIWNGSLLSATILETSFKAITRRLAGVWSKAPHDPGLVSMVTHPVYNQLLALASSGEVYVLTHEKGITKRRLLVKLSDFSHRYFAAPSLFSRSPGNHIQLFCFHTYYGVCHKGELRLYDSFTGEFVWECEEYEGMETRLWCSTPTSPHSCGLYNNSGLWLLKSKRVTEHAAFMAHALFPIATNADETTPGDFLDNGRMLAARLCQLWGLELLSTKYSLEAAYTVVKGSEEDTKQPFLPELSHELMELLGGGSLQNPALLVALLAEHPSYRHTVSVRVSQFLETYQSSEQETTNETITQLNAEIAPLLEKYQELAQEYEHVLNQELPHDGCVCPPAVRETVHRILSLSEQSTLDSSYSGNMASLQSHLHTLSRTHPHETLLGIEDFFGVTNFKEAVEQMEGGEWQSKRNWKGIFAMKSAPEVQKGYIPGSTHHILIFETTCRLLYSTHPEELVPFVTFAQLARDYEATGDSTFTRKCRKNFFYQRALDALPEFISLQATPTSPQAIEAQCQLLLKSDHAHPEMAALQLLTSNKMWSQSILLLEQTKPQSNHATHCAMFHHLLTQLSKAGALQQHLERVWRLLPEKFGVFDLLSILKAGRTHETDHIPPLLLPYNSTDTPLSSVTPKLLELLRSTTADH